MGTSQAFLISENAASGITPPELFYLFSAPSISAI